MNPSKALALPDLNEISAAILSLLTSDREHEELIREIVLLVQNATSFEAVGLRLVDGLDFPYYFTKGFDPEFVQKEMFLCARDQEGEMIRNSEGNPYLECMCGNVIEGRTDPSLPFFSEYGTFWTNSTTALLASTTEHDRQARTRNRCNGEGYESVALVPVRSASKTHGLLQLNDHRKDRFTSAFIPFVEGIASCIGLLFSMKQAKDRLAEQAGDITRVYDIRTRLLKRIAKELEERSITFDDIAATDQPHVLDKLRVLIDEFDVFKGILPICSQCKKVRTDNGYWEQIESYIHNRSATRFTHTFCPKCYEMWLEKLDDGQE
ncbi:MAG: hypothetical protein ABIK28_19090 [Planctomycetota bacterium]